MAIYNAHSRRALDLRAVRRLNFWAAAGHTPRTHTCACTASSHAACVCVWTPRTARGPHPSLKVGCFAAGGTDAQLSLHLLQEHGVTPQPRREFCRLPLRPPCRVLYCAVRSRSQEARVRTEAPAPKEKAQPSPANEEGWVRGTERANGSAWYGSGALPWGLLCRPGGWSSGADDGQGLNAPTEPMAALSGCGTRGCRHAS